MKLGCVLLRQATKGVFYLYNYSLFVLVNASGGLCDNSPTPFAKAKTK